MSLRYMGVPDWCPHGDYEDRCELCKRDREIKVLKADGEHLLAELRRVGIVRDGAITRCLLCGASADLGDTIEHTSECSLNRKGA